MTFSQDEEAFSDGKGWWYKPTQEYMTGDGTLTFTATLARRSNARRRRMSSTYYQTGEDAMEAAEKAAEAASRAE